MPLVDVPLSRCRRRASLGNRDESSMAAICACARSADAGCLNSVTVQQPQECCQCCVPPALAATLSGARRHQTVQNTFRSKERLAPRRGTQARPARLHTRDAQLPPATGAAQRPSVRIDVLSRTRALQSTQTTLAPHPPPRDPPPRGKRRNGVTVPALSLFPLQSWPPSAVTTQAGCVSAHSSLAMLGLAGGGGKRPQAPLRLPGGPEAAQLQTQTAAAVFTRMEATTDRSTLGPGSGMAVTDRGLYM
jgi:hypothetical protein